MTWKFCDHPDCLEPPEAAGRRFCAPHRRQHARHLLRQLDAVRGRLGDMTAAEELYRQASDDADS